ncbi:cation-translocating P-type ATPase [Corynebacterium sp. 320]|uniref:Cation-translocating P-type ATPase n=1 Tax=Corynebacterium zhongnanshanii TaxID=2768834 RepID=A0ABQ6VEI5_9CORY|nr:MULTISPECIES: HAD-IC family P-type ATPase [Corynebacterium]KAB1504410.1 cation-translocating P-type ATPase [Corynebacterium sp. 320]KAB1552491.1 cation-translocating P-type ATPase [Corynebacterium sp. 321]KAB1554294.1 cation-translocating P-type ATPase [Corynebacterium sp. 319]KAB3522733.1 cation-translocating P-type ATPase [Corynebacterium zhongnanshanii]KAB3528546.1 cation-translocating P-type ATPase [Corynebacterium sp. 250]
MADNNELLKVDQAIKQAREAARSAGLSGEDLAPAAHYSSEEHDSLQRMHGRGLTSLAYNVETFESAVSATKLQDALNEIDGVEAVVVYGTKQVWITAPDSINLTQIEQVFLDLGVDAWMSDSSLRRRIARMERPNAPRARRNVDAHRRAWAAAERMKRQNDAQVLLSKSRPFESTEVLFTARELITKTRLVVAILLGVPVIVLQLVGSLQFDYWQWVCLALATPVVLWSAWPFHRAALGGLRRGMSALDSASSAAIALAYLFSIYQLVTTHVGDVGWKSQQILLAATWSSPEYEGSLFFDVACGATILLLIGRLLSRRNTLRGRTLLNVLAISPHDTVTVVRKDRKDKKGKATKKDITVGEIRTGDDILIPNGMTFPADCEVISGKSLVDMGPVGGLHRVREVSVNDIVYAGARNHGATLKCRTVKTGSKTRLASMHRWVLNAARDENRLAQLSTRSASLLVPWALLFALIAFGIWWLITESVDAAMATSLSVLATVAPVALAMSAPLALRLGLWRAATEGALLRDTTTIHNLAQVESMVFNRVGTLTHGPMQVIGITAAQGENPDLVLRVASALVMESKHAVSKAIVRADREARDASAGGDEVPNWLEIGDVTITQGGVFEGVIEIPINGEMRNVPARLWRPSGVGELRDSRLAAAVESGGSPVVVSWKGKDRGVINLADSFKDDAPQAIDKLEELGLETYMLSRDPYPVARRLADSVGISTVLAGISPNRKEATVRALHSQGVSVGMVGDQDVLGALRVADIGILMGSADRVDAVAAEIDGAADVVLLREDVEAVPEIVNLVRHIRNTVDWNIWLSWGYNIVTLVLAMCGLLNPLLATLCMLASSSLIEFRSARILRRSYARTMLRSTHAWQSWVAQFRDLREMRKRSKLRAEAIEFAQRDAAEADASER